jgi:hypothetical protein
MASAGTTGDNVRVLKDSDGEGASRFDESLCGAYRRSTQPAKKAAYVCIMSELWQFMIPTRFFELIQHKYIDEFVIVLVKMVFL